MTNNTGRAVSRLRALSLSVQLPIGLVRPEHKNGSPGAVRTDIRLVRSFRLQVMRPDHNPLADHFNPSPL